MGSVFLRGDSWVGEHRVNGKTRRKHFGKQGVVTKTSAKEMLRKIEQEVKLGQYDMLDAEIPKLNEFAEDYIKYIRDTKKNRSWKRDNDCLNHFKNFFGDRKLSEIKVKDIDDYKDCRLKQGREAGTINRELSVLRAMFNHAITRDKFFGKNPVTKSKLIPNFKVKERILTLEEEEILLSQANGYLKPIIRTALNTGMRKKEILTLKWSNIDMGNGIITIEPTNSKSKRTVKIPINSEMRKLLVEQKLKSGRSEFVFLSEDGKPYKREDSLKSFDRLCDKLTEDEGKKIDLSTLRFHDLRHTAASRMIDRGANIVAVSKILGHADIKTTMRYTHPDNSLIEAVESLAKAKFSDSVTDKFTDTGEIKN